MEGDAAITQQTNESFEPTFAARPSKRLAVFGLAGLFAVFLASVLFRPPAGDYFTVCGFKNLTGLPCPGCGLTHSFCALGKGEVAEALEFNALGPPLFFVLVLLWIRSAFVLADRGYVFQRLDRIAGRLKIVRLFAFTFGVYGIARVVYVIVYSPGAFRDSPLSHLIGRLIH